MNKVILKTIKRETTLSRTAVRSAIDLVYKSRNIQAENGDAPGRTTHIKAESKKA